MTHQSPNDRMDIPLLFEVSHDISMVEEWGYNAWKLALGKQVVADTIEREYVWVFERGPHQYLSTEILV